MNSWVRDGIKELLSIPETIEYIDKNEFHHIYWDAEEYELIYVIDVFNPTSSADRIKITLENKYYGDLVSLWFKVSFINSKTNEEAMNFIISADEL